MSTLNSQDFQSQDHSEENLEGVPITFASAIARLKNLALEEFDREIAQKQLYYHTREHINNVQHRANIIFQAIRPYWETSLKDNAAPEYMARMQLLLDICATAHDMLQLFVPETQPHKSRRREMGVSETATIEKLFEYIDILNQEQGDENLNSLARFSDADLVIIRDAIEATICIYEPSEQAIYQPALYDSSKPLSALAIIIALADIGALGMEGVAAYEREGSLLFLEENPDVIPILLNHKTLASENPELYENIRQRLLRRARFQISFAKSRLTRYASEIEHLPADAIQILTYEVFQYLNPKTIQEIDSKTPTAEDTPLEVLITFFKLEHYINSIIEKTGVENEFTISGHNVQIILDTPRE
ncbi:hypothetical protein QUA40_21210 [Microcoleus sp. Pol11C3]|uniref:hypothetical protein n=1 Tax=Microcoleus sp. Pol11C3 TaxID=3055390 RepID=UPI002FD0DA21